MQRRRLIQALATLPLSHVIGAEAATTIHVYKDPNCGCCTGWAQHLSRAGYAVQITTTNDTAAVRRKVGMPDAFGGCHTATVAGYAIEGHVPATEIRRLLSTKPRAIGLAVVGMPVGSPGMEAGERSDPYQVLLIHRDGKDSVYASYPKA
jgi:hypothetical protein